MSECLDKIQNYLMSGGLFNPELMEHEKVRDMVIECKKEITRLKKALEIAKETINVSANQLEGIALAFTAHGTNLNVKFMIENCYENARQAREAQKQIKELMEG